MINEEFIKTELETLAADLIQVVEEIDRRKADREEWLAEVAKLHNEADNVATVRAGAAHPGLESHRGLERELRYIFGRMEHVLSYIAQPALGSGPI